MIRLDKNLPADKILSKEEMSKFRGGDGYCATQFAIISCNPGTTTYWFNYYGCNNGTPGAQYWSAAVVQGIPMDEGSCNSSWYGS